MWDEAKTEAGLPGAASCPVPSPNDPSCFSGEAVFGHFIGVPPIHAFPTAPGPFVPQAAMDAPPCNPASRVGDAYHSTCATLSIMVPLGATITRLDEIVESYLATGRCKTWNLPSDFPAGLDRCTDYESAAPIPDCGFTAPTIQQGPGGQTVSVVFMNWSGALMRTPHLNVYFQQP